MIDPDQKNQEKIENTCSSLPGSDTDSDSSDEYVLVPLSELQNAMRDFGRLGLLFPIGMTREDACRMMYTIKVLNDDAYKKMIITDDPDMSEDDFNTLVLKTAYLDLFEWNDGRLYTVMKDQVLKSAAESMEKHEKLRQAFATYEQELYYPCACALVSMVEGEMGKALDSSSTKLYELMRLLSRQSNHPEKVFIYEGLAGFLSQLARSANFAHDQEPESINRHWLLHGRSERRVDKLDCLSLFTMYREIIELIDYSRNQTESEENHDQLR